MFTPYGWGLTGRVVPRGRAFGVDAPGLRGGDWSSGFRSLGMGFRAMGQAFRDFGRHGSQWIVKIDMEPSLSPKQLKGTCGKAAQNSPASPLLLLSCFRGALTINILTHMVKAPTAFWQMCTLTDETCVV